MTPGAVQQIVRRLPAGTLTVGVFRDERPETVCEVVNRAGLKAAQLHGNEGIEDCAHVAERVPLVIKALAAGDRRLADLEFYPNCLLLVDSPTPGSGRLFDWRLTEGLPRARKLILAGGLDAENVSEAVRSVRPFGVDVSSGVEASPGRKDPSKMRAFVQAVRAAEPATYEPGEEELFDWQLETNL
jgi:phosphoribosylanthranilate isomerase